MPEAELRHFRLWFDKFDAKSWDRDMTSDIANGKLDNLAAEALSEYDRLIK